MKKSPLFSFYNVMVSISLLLMLGFSSCNKDDNTSTTGTAHLLTGNPSNATQDVVTPENYLIDLPQYALSYNESRGIPNWVSWHLNLDWLGTVDRQDDFRDYADLPVDFYKVKSTDYSGSGFDRGHNCPSGDRTNTIEDNSATFLMINMIPQAPDLNQETWRLLEEYCRKLVEQEGKELYIIMGNYGKGGTGNNGYKTTIANGKVTVPTNVWKVIVVLDEGDNDLDRINTNTRVIAVDIPNKNSVNLSSWAQYRVSVDDIEQATGYNILSNISTSLQNYVEARVDDGPTQ
ncbi:MAG: DNA/RNA non-specific endonuclease [Saprospiraceae bacterium]|nr:DNA/RNA non-specific endonuclease [Saprospiraceae bacterium]